MIHARGATPRRARPQQACEPQTDRMRRDIRSPRWFSIGVPDRQTRWAALSRQAFVALTDFGIATARFHGRLTASGRAMGTPHYMSPEQAMGKLVDGRSDLYAVGLLLYEMLLGHPPFDGEDSYAVGYKHVHEAPVAPDQVDTRIPAALSAITMKCLAKQAVDRYDRGFDLADALIAFLGQSAGAELRAARASRPAAHTPF